MIAGCPWRERVALYAGGDLDSDEARAAELHLEVCEACRAFAQGLRADLAGLRAERERPIDPAHFVRLRARVMERVRGERGRLAWRRAGWMATAALAATILLLLVVPKPRPIATQPRVAREAPVEYAHPVVHQAAVRRSRRRVHHVRQSLTSQPIVVKLVTDDPNVVIYWITDNKGETPQ